MRHAMSVSLQLLRKLLDSLLDSMLDRIIKSLTVDKGSRCSSPIDRAAWAGAMTSA